jgi:hypothetical protein
MPTEGTKLPLDIEVERWEEFVVKDKLIPSGM